MIVWFIIRSFANKVALLKCGGYSVPKFIIRGMTQITWKNAAEARLGPFLKYVNSIKLYGCFA